MCTRVERTEQKQVQHAHATDLSCVPAAITCSLPCVSSLSTLLATYHSTPHAAVGALGRRAQPPCRSEELRHASFGRPAADAHHQRCPHTLQVHPPLLLQASAWPPVAALHTPARPERQSAHAQEKDLPIVSAKLTLMVLQCPRFLQQCRCTCVQWDDPRLRCRPLPPRRVPH